MQNKQTQSIVEAYDGMQSTKDGNIKEDDRGSFGFEMAYDQSNRVGKTAIDVDGKEMKNVFIISWDSPRHYEFIKMTENGFSISTKYGGRGPGNYDVVNNKIFKAMQQLSKGI